MAPVINTYGVKKKKRARLPKFICDTDDVFESLNIENIKEAKALLEDQEKLKAKKKRTVRKPFYSLGCSNDADSTFDRLLKEGPTRSCTSPPKCSDSSSTDTDSSDFCSPKKFLGKKKNLKVTDSDSSDFCSRPKKAALRKKVLKTNKRGRIKSEGSLLQGVRGRKKSADDSFFTKVAKASEKLKKEDSFFTIRDGCEQTKVASKDLTFESTGFPTPKLSNGTKKFLSPILPINLTSTPHEKMASNPFKFSLCHKFSDTAITLNDESVINKKSVNCSVDLFSSFECQKPINEKNEVSSVDMFNSFDQGGANGSPDVLGKCDTSLPENCSQSAAVESEKFKFTALLPEQNFTEDSCIILNGQEECVQICDSVSQVDVTGCSDSNLSHSKASVEVEKLTTSPREICFEEMQTKSSNMSDPSIRDCVVMLSRCDLTELPEIGANARDTTEDINGSEPSLLNADIPSSHLVTANAFPLKDCAVVLHKCDARMALHQDSCSFKTSNSSCSVYTEVESQDTVATGNCSVLDDLAKAGNPSIPHECRVALSRCDDSVILACNAGANTDSSSQVTCSPPSSSNQESNRVSFAGLSPVMRHSIALEPVVLKPGKHWRRSLSILSKIRTSIGESNSRKSLAVNEGTVKGKRYESSVNSLIQMQSNRDAILEDLEESGTSFLLNETAPEKTIVQSNENDSIIICEMPPQINCLSSASEVLRRCGQKEPLAFLECYPASMKKQCKKIGEGVYGEVFLYSESGNPVSVIKIIPIEGAMEVNGEPQKTFREIFSEVCVAQELSDLRKGTHNSAWTFNEVQAIRCVQGSYPQWLQDLWHDFNDTKGSENDCPDVFQEDQLFIVLELRHGGKDLESFVFSSADQGLAAFKQIALTLAVGEKALNFEHRDLHWGNVLISSTKTKTVGFTLDGEARQVPSKGVEVSMIDFTLSRINNPQTGDPVFYDLSRDETLFTAQGDYQFEIYRLMKEFCGNKWDSFTPKTNIAWLHYLLDKLCTGARYRNRTSKVHGNALDKLRELKDSVLQFNDVVSFVNCSIFL